jgi:hypothetical protein
MKKLERSFGCSRVRMAEPEIAVDDADRRKTRKVVSLGHDLGANYNVGLAALDLPDDLAQLAQRRD